MNTYVISDIHGAYKGLMQCIDRSPYNPDQDRLICLGDVADGWPEVRECFEYLMGIPNLIYCLGNHDKWTLDYLKDPRQLNEMWITQGGRATIQSYAGHQTETLQDFLNNSKLYFEDNGRIYCHAGFPPNMSPTTICNVDDHMFIWDRNLVKHAIYNDYSDAVANYSEVFIGHTPTLCYGSLTPKNYSNVWLMDTGASYTGSVTIMDVNTKEYWQSDVVCDLYPNHTAR